jgi:predicted RNA binding protein YcfA (HicA-like mRNA interferase family)
MSRLPALKPAEVERALRRAGYTLDHSRGSHRYYRHPDRSGLVTLPFHSGTLKRGLLFAIIKQAGLTVEEFRKLL